MLQPGRWLALWAPPPHGGHAMSRRAFISRVAHPSLKSILLSDQKLLTHRLVNPCTARVPCSPMLPLTSLLPVTPMHAKREIPSDSRIPKGDPHAPGSGHPQE